MIQLSQHGVVKFWQDNQLIGTLEIQLVWVVPHVLWILRKPYNHLWLRVIITHHFLHSCCRGAYIIGYIDILLTAILAVIPFVHAPLTFLILKKPDDSHNHTVNCEKTHANRYLKAKWSSLQSQRKTSWRPKTTSC